MPALHWPDEWPAEETGQVAKAQWVSMNGMAPLVLPPRLLIAARKIQPHECSNGGNGVDTCGESTGLLSQMWPSANATAAVAPYQGQNLHFPRAVSKYLISIEWPSDEVARQWHCEDSGSAKVAKFVGLGRPRARASQVNFDSPETWSNKWPALRMVSEQESRAASVNEMMAGARTLSFMSKWASGSPRSALHCGLLPSLQAKSESKFVQVL